MMNTKPRFVLAIACSIFLVFGVYNAGIGPVLNELARQTGSTLAAVGSVLTFLFLGSLVAQIAAGPLTDKFGQRLILIVSLLLIVVGLSNFTNARSLPLMLAMVFIAGLGQGGVDLGANLIVSDAYPKNNTSVLNLLHFFFGLGAFTGPALVGLAIARTGSGLIVHWFAAGVFLLLAVAIFTIRGGSHKAAPRLKQGEADFRPGKSVYLSTLLWVSGILLLTYVGVEYGMGSWISNYMNSTTQMALQNGALVTSAYWGALTLGRLASAAVSRKISPMQLLTAALVGSMIAGAGLVLSVGKMIPTIIFITLMGFSYGNVYPTTIAVTVAAFPSNQGKAVGLLAAMGSIGGLALPVIAGVLLEKVSPLAYAFFITGVLVLMFIFLLILIRIRKRATSAQA